MAITTFLDPAAMPNRSMDQQTFDNAYAALLAKLPTFGAEVNSTAANLNSIAAGGAYAIPYTFDSATTDSDPGPGKLRLGNTTQYLASVLRVDTASSAGQDWTSALNTFDASGSTVKGTVRLTKVGDPSKFLLFEMTSRASAAGYLNFTVTHIASSGASPFVNGDALMLFFQRTGDKGDTGAMGTYQSAKFSDRKANGTAGGASSSVNVTQTRTLNTTDYNTITGASLSSNQVTLPAGTYDVFGRAPAVGVTAHRSALYNVTDSTYPLIGSSASTGSSTSNGISSDSVFTGRITLAAAKTFTIRHWTGSTGANTAELGQPSSGSGQLEVYTEVIFTKVA